LSATSVRNVLVLCTGNSARSQMLEAILATRLGDRFEVTSAGTEPAERVHPLAVRALGEIGIAWTNRVPKRVADLDPAAIDLAITVCDRAKESCPVLPGAPRRVHVGYPDPAAVTGTEAERLDAFRSVRDHMLGWTEIAAALLGV
jgi:arsenate reductase